MTAARPLALASLLLTFAVAPLCAADKPADKGALPDEVSFYKDVRPIFQQHCNGCHQPAKPSGGYVMTSRAEMLKAGESEKNGVVPGKADASNLVSQVTPHDGKKPLMPRNLPPLGDREVSLIKKWIAQGARDDTPVSDRVVIDMDHPPTYLLPPVIASLAYSPDGKLLAVAGRHEVLIHKADGSGLVARLVGQSERVQSVAFSPDGKLLAVAGGSPALFGEVQVWDVERKRLKVSQSVTFDTLYGVSWAHDGSKVAFGCADNTVRAIDAATGKEVLYQGAHNDWVLGTTFSADSDYLVSVSRDMTAKLTHVPTQRFIDNVTSITPGALKGGLVAVARRPFKVKKMTKPKDISVGEVTEKVYDELLFGGSDGTPRLYKMHREVKRVIGDDANKIREYEPMPGVVESVAFSADGKLFAAGSRLSGTGEVRVYEVDSGKRVSTFAGQKGGVFTVAFGPDGKAVASAGFDGVVRLNDPATGKLIKEFVPVPGLKSTTAAK
ncbi:MAG TPA: c-type cytochrome domain-containing protein [Gemmataceae bacterium]|nr:c-type cytochrome domain-containing protein [Gemmataceae bacterium]